MSDKEQNYGVFIAILLVLFFSMSTVAAHQPRLETGTNVSMNNPIVVQNPEISQARILRIDFGPWIYNGSLFNAHKI